MAEKKNTPSIKEKLKNFSLSSLIYNDKYLVVLCVFMAVIVWISTSLSVGTNETRTVRIETPVILSDQVSEQLGMQYYSLQENIELRVTVSGPKYIVGQVGENDLDITFDTSAINRTGEHTVPIIVTDKSRALDFTVDSVYPSTVNVFYDINASKTVDVDLLFDNDNVADGYVFGTPVLTDDKVVVSGPKTYIDRLESAYCQVSFGDKKDLTESITQDCDIFLQGSDIETRYMTISSRKDTTKPIKALSVTLPVLKVVDLPVSVTFEDMPEDIGDDIVSVSYSVSDVSVGVLSTADVSTVNLGSIYFNELSVGKQTFEFKTDSIKGATVLENVPVITATVTVSSNYSEQNVKISRDDIVIEGGEDDANLRVTYLDDTTVTVLAPRGVTITPADLTLKCDVSNASKDNRYPVKISVNNKSCWVYGKYVATIK